MLRIDDIKFSSNEKNDLGRVKRGLSPDFMQPVEITFQEEGQLSGRKKKP
jgi:hypothetical protein